MFNNTYIIRYPRPQKVVFEKGSKLKWDLTPFLNDLYIKPVLTKIKNSQDNALVERVYQVILNLVFTKYLADKVFYYIYKLGETLASIEWSIMDSCRWPIQVTPGQAVFGRDMIFNLASVIDWRVITAGKQQQVDIDNVQENTRGVTHDYAISNLVYLEITGIYHKLYYS